VKTIKMILSLVSALFRQFGNSVGFFENTIYVHCVCTCCETGLEKPALLPVSKACINKC
jgi:hypothetical protein